MGKRQFRSKSLHRVSETGMLRMTEQAHRKGGGHFTGKTTSPNKTAPEQRTEGNEGMPLGKGSPRLGMAKSKGLG